MRQQLYTQFFAAWNAANLPMERHEFILANTNDKHSSLKTVSILEMKQMINVLNGKPNNASTQRKTPREVADGLRKAIISIFHKMHYSDAASAAKEWSEKMGVGAGDKNVKKQFNAYTNQELKALLTKAEIALKDYEAVVREELKKL